MTESSPESRPTVGAVIVNFNSGLLLVKAIESLLASSRVVQVIVSDNDSTDGSPELVDELSRRDPRVLLIRNGTNLGFARANNIALEQASGDFLLVLNPDCVLESGALDTVVAALQEDPSAGMAGCLIQNPDGSEQPGCRRSIPTPLSSLAVFSRLDRFLPGLAPPRPVHLNLEPLPEGPAPVEAISGAFMLLRRAAMEDVGLFDERYFLHCEDLDWCARFSQRGWKILFVPGARAVHFKGTCSRDRPVFVLWHKHKGMARFYRKFQYRDHSLPLNWLVVAGIWGRFTMLTLHALVGSLRGRLARGAPFRDRRLGSSCAVPPALLDRVAPPMPEGLRDKRVLVTGGTGFIGRHLVRALCRTGAVVRVLTRSTERIGPSDMDDVEIRVGDLTQPLATRGICEGIDVVFHLASHAHALDENDAEGAASHRLVTAQGARLLLQDALSHGVKRLVFLSSVKAMGEGGSDPQAEADPPRPASPYGEAKLAAERVLLEGSEGRIATTVLRLPMVYGPGCKGNLPRLIDAIARGRFPPWPRLDNRRSSVHVTDVVRAALTVACDPRAAGQVYLLCEDRDYSTRWLYEQISLALGRRPPSWSVPYGVLRLAARAASLLERLGGRKLPFNEEVLEKLAGDARYSSEKIRSELGFATVYSLETELPLMVRDYLGERQAPPGSSKPGAAHAAEGTGAGVALPRR